MFPYDRSDDMYSKHVPSSEYNMPLNYSYPSHTHLHAPVPHQSYTFPSIDQSVQDPCSDEYQPFARSALDYYASSAQLLFPTPSELLSSTANLAPSSSDHHPLPVPAPPGQAAVEGYTSSLPEVQKHDRRPQASTSAGPAVNKTETQRKARQRAVAEEIGFTPTDPDTISSHEKKRHYLECLEHYVLYLHEQLRLVEIPPLALERVSTYRGLSSRSIRTLLVHMQAVNKSLHQNILTEEQAFLDLSTEVVAAHDADDPTRRHSVDVVTMSDYRVGPSSVLPGLDDCTFNETALSTPSVGGNAGDTNARLALNISGHAGGSLGRM
ncbi:hypothetical protein ID866_12705 [Astraeus odoratus]|nr:hypothetical protein ID866_12705 [Astraeus odoratus]